MKKFLSLILLVLFFFASAYSQINIKSTHRACCIGPINHTYGGDIYVRSPAMGDSWVQIGGKAKSVSFDYQGSMYVINTEGRVYERYLNGGWSQVGLVISGTGKDICALNSEDGPVAVTSTGAYRFNGSSWSTIVTGADFNRVATSGLYTYILKENSDVVEYYDYTYQRTISGGHPHTPISHDISCNSDGTLWRSVSFVGVSQDPFLLWWDDPIDEWRTHDHVRGTHPAYFDLSEYANGGVLYMPFRPGTTNRGEWVNGMTNYQNLVTPYIGATMIFLIDIALGDGDYAITSSRSRSSSSLKASKVKEAIFLSNILSLPEEGDSTNILEMND